MPAKIPEQYRDLLEGAVYAVLTTLMPDGQPQSSLVWCDCAGDTLLVNTVATYQKVKNMQRDSRVSLLAVDTGQAGRYLEVRGRVTEMREEGALAHMNKLAKQYLGVDTFYGNAAPKELEGKERRLLCCIVPERVRGFG